MSIGRVKVLIHQRQDWWLLVCIFCSYHSDHTNSEGKNLPYWFGKAVFEKPGMEVIQASDSASVSAVSATCLYHIHF